MANLTPKRIVKELDKHIVGQTQAKKSVAIALRNRWRRMQTKESIRHEITPKNILMIGPTGVGKTEISRRLALLIDAPFIKVEATKFTEVGYVGRDVESIIRDLTDIAIKKEQKKQLTAVQVKAREQAIEKILDILLPQAEASENDDTNDEQAKQHQKTREKFKVKINNKTLDDKEIEINLNHTSPNIEVGALMPFDNINEHLQEFLEKMQSAQKNKQRVPIKRALELLQQDCAQQLINHEKIKEQTLINVMENGIVFLDEIDKITSNHNNASAAISREGVQRDLLPLIEGSSVSTKYGIVETNHILFIASGAFHLSKPADLIPELQGRLPIRVELDALNEDDFYRILSEPNMSLIEQYQAMLATEDFQLKFEKKALKRIATLAYQVNENTENIGARRLHTLLEKLLSDICYDVPDIKEKSITITCAYVDEQLTELSKNQDLSRYIL